MCTLIALFRCYDEAPLVVAANRDEFYERPAEGPALRLAGSVPIVAPRDVQAGGTWLGLNAAGVFAAVTNRPCEAPDPERRSRGQLVLDALGADCAARAAEELEDLEAGAYNPFNLCVADRDGAFAITYDEKPRGIELSAGAHVIGNADPAEPTPKVERLAARADAVAAGPPERALDDLARLCAGHEGGDVFRDACVHAGRYGTRSSPLLSLTDADPVLRYADGPPCVTSYDDFTPLLHELGPGSRLVGGERTRKVS